MYFLNGHGLGQVGTQDEIRKAAEQHKKMLDSGQLIPTKNLGQDAQFAFDPREPDIIYAVTAYLGNGPGGKGWPHFTSIAPAKYRYVGNPPIPWVGNLPLETWLKDQPAEVQQRVKAKLAPPAPKVTATATTQKQTPGIPTSAEPSLLPPMGQNLPSVGGIPLPVVGVAFGGLILSLVVIKKLLF